MTWWQQLKFMIKDRRASGPSRVDNSSMRAVRDASHVVGGRGANPSSGPSDKTLRLAAEANDRYNASFKKD